MSNYKETETSLSHPFFHAEPDWVHGFGTDDYGHWASFLLWGTQAPQVMRWIVPGTFLMGLPENEPERFGVRSPVSWQIPEIAID